MEWLIANWFIIVIPLLILSLPIYIIVSTVNLKKDEKKRLEQWLQPPKQVRFSALRNVYPLIAWWPLPHRQ